MVKDREAKEILDAEISFLVIFKPLYGIVFLYLNKIEVNDEAKMPTMGVGPIGKVDLGLFYNPEFVKKLPRDELAAVLQHEALHILLHHITRGSHYDFNPKNYNITADLAINCNLSGLPDFALFPKKFNLPDYESAEWYYAKLKMDADNKQTTITALAEGKGDMVGDHSMWGDCDGDIVGEKVRGIAQKAIKGQESKGWGDIPGNIASAVIAANKPKINWRKEVRYFINQMILAGRQSTRMRPNRRYGFVNPGAKKSFRSRLLVGIDTSGSVSDAELQLFLEELNGMIDHVETDLIFFDTQLYDKPKPFDKKAKKLNVVGRGGTCFTPIVNLVDELNYDGLIIMTDGFAPFPNKPRARAMWCLTPSGESVIPPWGKRVVIELKK